MSVRLIESTEYYTIASDALKIAPVFGMHQKLPICFAQTYFAYYSNRNAFVTSIYLPIDGAQNPRNSSLKQWSGSSHVNHQS